MRPSRAMISGELFGSYVAFWYAIAGSGLPPFGRGQLHQLLEAHASPELWALLLGAPAVCLFVISLREWCAHTEWCRMPVTPWLTHQVERSAIWRGRLCLASLIGWAYILKVLVTDLQRLTVLAPIAFGACIFMWIYYKENRRVRREIRGNPIVRRSAQG